MAKKNPFELGWEMVTGMPVWNNPRRKSHHIPSRGYKIIPTPPKRGLTIDEMFEFVNTIELVRRGDANKYDIKYKDIFERKATPEQIREANREVEKRLKIYKKSRYANNPSVLPSPFWNNPKNRYKKNPLLMTVGLANPASPSFRPGQRVSIERFEKWLRANTDARIINEYEKTKQAYERFHLGSKPSYITYDPIEMSNIDGTKFFYSAGKAVTTNYVTPKTSKKAFNKGKGAYEHVWEGKKPQILVDYEGKTLMLPLKGKSKVTDWMHG